jgi:hypothetical protein
MKPITFRKYEEYVLVERTKNSFSLNPESFRNVVSVDPFEGSSEEEFLVYIDELYNLVPDNRVQDLYEELEDMGFYEDADNLDMLFGTAEMERFSGSMEVAEAWFEIRE